MTLCTQKRILLEKTFTKFQILQFAQMVEKESSCKDIIVVAQIQLLRFTSYLIYLAIAIKCFPPFSLYCQWQSLPLLHWRFQIQMVHSQGIYRKRCMHFLCTSQYMGTVHATCVHAHLSHNDIIQKMGTAGSSHSEKYLVWESHTCFSSFLVLF